MKTYDTFNEMYNDDEFLSPKKRTEIDFEVEIIGKMIEEREAKAFLKEKLSQDSERRSRQ